MTTPRRIARIIFTMIGLSSGAGPTSFGLDQDPTAQPRATTPAPQDARPPDANDPMVMAIVAAHNKMRADEKLPPLSFAPLLARAAQVQASDMADHGEMKHEGSDGSTPAERIKRAGYHFQTSGENVAVFYPDVPQVMQAWFDSPPHRKNILGDFPELIAYLESGRFPVDEVISRTVSLDQAGAALAEWSTNPGPITKIMVHFDS